MPRGARAGGVWIPLGRWWSECAPRWAQARRDFIVERVRARRDRLRRQAAFEYPENRVPSVTFTDLEATWHAPWRAYFTFGVRNALDRTPPVSYSAFANSFFPDYDLPGRFFYVRYCQQFP